MVFSQVGPLSPPLYLVHSFLSFRSLFKSHLFVCVGGGCLLSLHIDLVYWLWTPIIPPPCRASLIAQLVKNPPAMQETPVRFDSWVGKIHWRRDSYPLQYSRASLVAQLVKNLPTMREIWVRSLGWKDPLEKGKATHSSILAWRIPGYSPWGHKESDTTE